MDYTTILILVAVGCVAGYLLLNRGSGSSGGTDTGGTGGSGSGGSSGGSGSGGTGTGGGTGGTGTGGGSGGGSGGTGGSGGSGSGGAQAPEFAKLSQLSSDAQSAINNFTNTITAQGIFYNQQEISFYILKISDGAFDTTGIMFRSSDATINVILTFYEFANLLNASSEAVLTIPSRTLSDYTITTDPSSGYTVSIDSTVGYFKISINSVQGPVAKSLIDNGTSVSLTSYVPQANTVQPTEFGVLVSQLPNALQTNVSALLFGLGSNNPQVTYNSQQIAFTLTLIRATITETMGYLLMSQDGTIKIYMSSYEFAKLVNASSAAVLTIPSRTLRNRIITNDPSSGYTISINETIGTGLFGNNSTINITINTVSGPVTRSLVDGATTISLDS